MSSRPNLFAPYIAPRKLYVTIPQDDSNFGAQMNAAILDAINKSCNEVIMTPGLFTAEVPVNNPGRVHVRGMGVREPNSYGNALPAGINHGPTPYGGGVMIRAPFNSTTGCLTAIGTNPNGNDATGMIYYPRFSNIACTGATPLSRATAAGGPPKLIKLVNCYGFELDGVSAHNDYHQGLYVENCWEFHINKFRGNALGYSDETASPSDAAVIAYTNRQPLAVETATNRSYGVAAVEFYSPNTTGSDTDNNGRVYDSHLEGNYGNGCGLMVRGGNGNNLTMSGWHIELVDGNVPLVVAQGISGFRLINSFMHGGGTVHKTKPHPGLVILGDAVHPRIEAILGFQGGQAALQAMIQCIGTQNSYIDTTMVGGGDALTPTGAAALVFNNCGQVTQSRNLCYNWTAAPARTAPLYSFTNGSTGV